MKHSFLEVLRANRRAVDKMIDLGARRELLDLLRAANSELNDRLHGMRRKDTFTAVHARTAKAEIIAALRHAEGAFREHVVSRSIRAGRVAVVHAKDVIEAGERQFHGIAYELPIERALKLDARLSGNAASLLRQHEASTKRYGRRMLGEFEREMRLGIIQKETMDDVVDRLVGHGGPKGVFVEKRWMAERVARTELLYSYNSASQLAIEESALELPDMRRIILAHFDRRTAMDSVFVHGQIKRIDEPFVDGDGRVYMVPPARPNDREVVAPYRLSWPVPASWMPRPKDERIEAAGGRDELTDEQEAELRRKPRASATIPHVSMDDVAKFRGQI